MTALAFPYEGSAGATVTSPQTVGGKTFAINNANPGVIGIYDTPKHGGLTAISASGSQTGVSHESQFVVAGAFWLRSYIYLTAAPPNGGGSSNLPVFYVLDDSIDNAGVFNTYGSGVGTSFCIAADLSLRINDFSDGQFFSLNLLSSDPTASGAGRNVANSAASVVPLNAWVRIEAQMECSTSGAGLGYRMRLFKGANVEGTTPDTEISWYHDSGGGYGTYANANNKSYALGLPQNYTGGYGAPAVLMTSGKAYADDSAFSDTGWCGPVSAGGPSSFARGPRLTR